MRKPLEVENNPALKRRALSQHEELPVYWVDFQEILGDIKLQGNVEEMGDLTQYASSREMLWCPGLGTSNGLFRDI